MLICLIFKLEDIQDKKQVSNIYWNSRAVCPVKWSHLSGLRASSSHPFWDFTVFPLYGYLRITMGWGNYK
jgi:hypothetical protein